MLEGDSVAGDARTRHLKCSIEAAPGGHEHVDTESLLSFSASVASSYNQTESKNIVIVRREWDMHS